MEIRLLGYAYFLKKQQNSRGDKCLKRNSKKMVEANVIIMKGLQRVNLDLVHIWIYILATQKNEYLSLKDDLSYHMNFNLSYCQ